MNAIYNKFPVGGTGRKALDNLTDIVVPLCGPVHAHQRRHARRSSSPCPGVLPITGISTAWQYLPIPVAGFVMSFDSDSS